MATTISNPASFSSVRSAFFNERYTETYTEIPGEPLAAAPTNLNAYRRGGGFVPDTAAFSAIATGVGEDKLRLSQFSGFTVPSRLQVNVTNQFIYAEFAGYESAFASARYGLSNLGNAFFQEEGDSGNNARQNIAGEWLVSGNGALISVKATLLSHSDTLYSNLSGTFGTFLPMTGEYEWILDSSLGQFQSQDNSSATFRIDLALTSDTNTILDTAEITLEVRTQTA